MKTLEKSLISVIIPIYNVAPYLERCLDSILNNTDSHYEVICIDDGSTDGCSDILDQYSMKDGRIKVTHDENHGVSYARNLGLCMSKGQWITFIDGDDLIHPQMFEIVRRYFDDSDIIMTGFRHIDNSVKEYKTINVPDVCPQVLDSVVAVEKLNIRFFVCGKFYKREILAGHTFEEDISFCEDFLFNLSVFGEKKRKVLYIKETLYDYYIRDGSASRTDKLKKQIMFCDVLLSHAEQADTKQMKRLYSISAVKRALTCRYDLLFEGWAKKKRKAAKRKCNEILEKGLHNLIRNRNSLKEYVQYLLFYRLPAIYLIGRIANDPKWECERWKSFTSNGHNFPGNNS